MVGRVRPLLHKILGQPDQVGAKSAIFNIYSPVEPHLAKKVQLTLIGSTLRAFQ